MTAPASSPGASGAARRKALAIPGFEIEAEIGRGGMGIVYRARQTSIGRAVAVKILPPGVSKDPAFVEKFLKEAKAAARLNHENVVAAIDAGKAGDTVYFVMELIEGETIRDRIDRDGPMPAAEALGVLRDTARALVHAQKYGIVHRDVKPDNIMVGKDGRALLCDLGLARRVEESQAQAGKRTGVAEGTPYYISPEQAKGFADVDIRSDIYALGATAYHMLAGEYAFDGEDARTIMLKQVHDPFPDIRARRDDLPAALVALLERMVEKDREKRVGSPAEVVSELDRILSGMRGAGTPPSAAAAEAGTEEDAGAVAGGAEGDGEGEEAPGGARADAASGPSLAIVGAGALAALAIAVVGGWLILGGPPPSAEEHAGGASAGPDGTHASSSAIAPPGEVVAESSSSGPTAAGAPSGTAGATGSPASLAAREAEAAMKLAVLEESLRSSGAEAEESIRRYRELLAGYAGTGAARKAEEAAKALAAKLAEPVQAALAKLSRQANDLAARGDFAGAASLLGGELDRSRGKPHEKALRDAIAKVEGLSDAAWRKVEAEARGLLSEGKSVEAVERTRQFAARAAGASAERATRFLEEARRSGDTVALAAAAEAWSKEVHDALERGAYPDAMALATRAQADEKWAPVKARIERTRREAQWTTNAAEAYRGALGGLKGRAELPLLAGGSAAGQLVELDPATLAATLWEGAKDAPATELRLADLDPAWLRARGLAPGAAERHLGNGLFLLYAGARAAAVEELRAAVKAGAELSPLLRGRLDEAARSLDEALALAIHRRGTALERIGRHDEALKHLARLLVRGDKSGTAYAKGRVKEIGDAWKSARAAQLLEGPVQAFFAGKVEGSGTRVRLRYEFDDPAEIADWKAESGEGIDGSEVRKVGKGAEMKGRVAWRGAWKGELALEVGFGTGGAGCQCNVVVYDKGRPYSGWLVGIGAHVPGHDKFRISQDAPRGAGSPYDSPAHVIVGFHGSKDPADYLFAARGPIMPSAGFRLGVTAKKRLLAVTLAGKPFASVTIPEADMHGGVAIQPFEGDKRILVQDVRMAGELDESWLDTEAARIAESELTSGKRLP